MDSMERLDISFAVERSFFEQVGTLSTQPRPIQQYAPGFSLSAIGTIACPNRGCTGKVNFSRTVLKRSSENATFKRTEMFQPTPEAVIEFLLTNLRRELENGKDFDPFYSRERYGYPGEEVLIPQHRVDCPECGQTFSATKRQKHAILLLALDFVEQLQPVDVQVWDENEEGILLPDGSRKKPGIVTHDPFGMNSLVKTMRSNTEK